MSAGVAQRIAAPRPSLGRPGEDFFSARPRSLADSVGRMLGERRPVVSALALWAIAFLLLGATIIGLGLLLTHVLLPAGLGRVDSSLSAWFVPRRTSTLDEVTRVGSALGSTEVILAAAGAIGLALAIARRWVQFVFLLYAMTLEFGVFLLTTLVVDRARPDASRLDSAPPTSSYPSGHTASSCTLYVGLAIVLCSFIRGRAERIAVWALAVLVPVAVGLSRVYRGMHYTSDVLAAGLLAGGALALALLAVRSLSAARREREEATELPASPDADEAETRPAAAPEVRA